MNLKPDINNHHYISDDKRFSTDKTYIDINPIVTHSKSPQNESATSIERLNDHRHSYPTVRNEQLNLHLTPSPDTSKQRLTISALELESSLSIGVDWSDKAHSTSHCWFPYESIDRSSVSTCAYASCTIFQPFRADSFIQCGSCAISIHKEHIADLEKTTDPHTLVPPCRPSFSDRTLAGDHHTHDRHYWSHVPKLTKPCILCQRKTLSRTFATKKTKILTIPSELHTPQVNAAGIYLLQHGDSKPPKPSSGLICRWCSQGCHWRCWENMNDNDDQNKCDYGQFKNIIVRPQWIHRVGNAPSRFQARFPDDIDPRNSSFTPLIVFTNKLSGGQKGGSIYRQLIRLLNPRQVFQLENDSTIKQALDIYSSLSNTRILVCGGDGSIGWMLSILAERFTSLNNPPVSICPLGTGNDLSRVLGWGRGYNTKRLLTTLLQIPNAQPIALDRWQVDFEPLTTINPIEESGNIRRCLSGILDHPKFVRETDPPSYQNYQRPLNVRFTNYISFGLDAAVVLDFHDKRMRDPSKFTSPFKNKLIYINTARHYFREFALWRAWNLRSYIRLICDGEDFTDSLRHCHTIVLLNIPSYGSGTRPWSRTYASSDPILTTTQNQTNRLDTSQIEGPPDYNYGKSKSAREDISDEVESTIESSSSNQIVGQSIADRKIEVLGLDSIQMALIHIGFRGRRIAQCREVRIELIRSMPVHMDGDPFYLPQSTAINVTHAGQVLVLRNEDT